MFEEVNIKGDLKKIRLVAGPIGWWKAGGLRHGHQGGSGGRKGEQERNTDSG